MAATVAAAGRRDTIVAVSTPLGASTIAVVRLSGPRAREAAAVLCDDAGGDAIRSATRRASISTRLREPLPAPTRVSVYPGPRSYTGEDLVELSLPGALPLCADVLARAAAGDDEVRLARPGEFTMRALLNGKLELGQVDAVARLLHAGGEAEARAAYRQLGGALAARVRGVAAAVRECLALVESGIDFPDEEIPAIVPEALIARVDGALESLDGLLRDTALRIPEPGHRRVVLVGHPNAGKSSLLNALTGARSALVSPHAGTTLDPVRAVTEHAGVRLEWVDLAGIGRATAGDGPSWEPWKGERAGSAESAALKRISERELDVADVSIWLADADALLDPAARGKELAGLERLRARVSGDASAGAEPVFVASKSDRLSSVERRALACLFDDGAIPGDTLLVSSLSGEGIPELVERLATPEPAHASPPGESVLLVSAGEESRIHRSHQSLSRAREALEDPAAGLELAAIDLRDAAAILEPLTDRELAEGVLDVVFRQFCVGK